MKIGLIDVDGHNFPNIPLMKLSAWHRQHADQQHRDMARWVNNRFIWRKVRRFEDYMKN